MGKPAARKSKGKGSGSKHEHSEEEDDKAFILRLPDELICSVAHHYNPSIPFELGHFVLAGNFRRDGRDELRALATCCKRFAKLLRPTLYRNLVFQDDKRRTKTVHLYKAKEVQEHVRELYWQPSYLYNDMSPVFLPLLQNLTYLILAFLPQSVPDEFISDDYAGLTTLRTSFTDALRQLPNLQTLEIPFWENAEDHTFRFDEALPKLTSISIGDWQEWEAFGSTERLKTVKWLIHPDLDLEAPVIEGFVNATMRHCEHLQFAAHSGWGRTDLPEKLPVALKEAEWYKDIADHPLESMTFHGFNPITACKEEWATLLPSFLSLLQMSHLKHIVFLDVPSARNDDRATVTWDEAEQLESVESVQIAVATEEDLKAAAGLDEAEGHGQDNESAEDRDGEGMDEKSKNHPELSQRIPAEDVYPMLGIFPNLQDLTLVNFLRCENPREHTKGGEGNDGLEDPTDRFAEEHFQPAARDFIRELGLYDRFQHLKQVVFRSVEAELAVRFRRTHGEHDPGTDDGWIEELRRLY
ncbi:hypothetical protein JCM11641_001449 [Rhodosporidiobolus odoratus]